MMKKKKMVLTFVIMAFWACGQVHAFPLSGLVHKGGVTSLMFDISFNC
ncbi:hypothetical protein [Candidatus Scalindua japonica]|nr:hypothetical protein [Candidatus Scalindua japonica]